MLIIIHVSFVIEALRVIIDQCLILMHRALKIDGIGNVAWTIISLPIAEQYTYISGALAIVVILESLHEEVYVSSIAYSSVAL